MTNPADGWTLFDLMRLERADVLAQARGDENDPDAVRLREFCAAKRSRRLSGSTDPEDFQ